MSIVLILLTLLALIPFVYISRYLHPINDDFSFALQHIDVSWWQSVKDSYMSWSGRYLATALSSLNPFTISGEPLTMFRCYSAILAFASFLIPVISSYILLRETLGTIRAIGAGCFFVLLFMSLCPSVSQYLYWFSSYTAYTIPGLLSLLFFCLLPRKNILISVILSVLALVIPGGNEVTAVLFVITLSYLAYTYRSKRMYLLLTLAIIAIAIVVLSPGNSVRMTHRHSASPYLWTIIICIGQTLSWFIVWIPSLLLASLVYIPIFGQRISQNVIFNVSFRRFLIFAVTGVILAHFPPAFGLSSVVIDRTANSLLIFFIMFYFWGLNIILHRYRRKITPVLNLLGKNKICMALTLYCFVFMLPLNINSPVVTAVCDIVTHKAQNYNQIHNTRLAMAKEWSSTYPGEALVFQGLGLAPKTLYINDIETVTNGGGEFSTDYCKIYDLNCNVILSGNNVFFEDNFSSLKSMSKKSR